MRAYFIDAAARKIDSVEYDSGFRKWLPTGICVAWAFNSCDVMYVEDEALNRKASVAFRIRDRPDGQPMMSNAILTGHDYGNTTLDPAMTRAELEQRLQWLTLPEALQWYYDRRDEPAVTTRRGSKVVVLATWGQYLANLEGKPGGYIMAEDPRVFE